MASTPDDPRKPSTPNISVGGMQITGIDEVLREAGDRLAQVFQAGVARAYVEAELVMTEAKMRTPVEHGTLRSSGHVPAPEHTREGVNIRLVFGGAAASYAIYVHEDLDAAHAEGTGAKFLESAHREAMPSIRNAVVAAMRDALQKR